MKKTETILYYFSATGNSLFVAKKINEHINNSEIVPIAKIWKDDKIKPESKKIGFIFPLYFWGIPGIINEFIKKIDFSDSEYIFYVITSGGISSPEYVTGKFRELLKTKNKKLNAGFRIIMPGNYIKFYNTDDIDLQTKKIKRAVIRASRIADVINLCKEKDRPDKKGFAGKMLNWLWRNNVEKSAKYFFLDEGCISCGLCWKVCPVNNIRCVNGKPVWENLCQGCLACIHSCPVRVIQNGRKTRNRGRYFNPEIDINEIINQKS